MHRNLLKLAYTLLLCTGSAHIGFAGLIDQLEIKAKKLADKTEFESRKVTKRWKHAREVLGKKYKLSIAKVGEEVLDLDDHLLKWTKRNLKEKWKTSANAISQVIIQESEKYDFDPIFILSIIKSESSFNPEAIGSSGEIGLMQLVPKTAKWIASLYHLPWKGEKSLKNPITNIRIGMAYLDHLRNEFPGHSQLYLSAYNMGSGNVQKAIQRQTVPQIYANRVIKHYLHFYSQLKHELQTLNHAYS